MIIDKDIAECYSEKRVNYYNYLKYDIDLIVVLVNWNIIKNGEKNMDLAIITATQVIELFILILCGAVLYKTNVIKEEGKGILSNLLIYLVIPAMIIDSYTATFDYEKLTNLIKAFEYSAVLLAVGIGISLLVTVRTAKDVRGIIRMACSFSNAGYMGFPLIKALFGTEGLLYATAFLTLFNILIWTVGLGYVAGSQSPKEVAKTIFTSPAVLSVFVGLAIFIGRIPVPEFIKTPIAMVGDMNTPISMVITGITIAGSNLKQLIKNKKLFFVITVRMFLIPIVGLLVMKLINASGEVAMITLILEACPTAAITTMFAIKYNNNEELAAGSVVFTTLLSIITLPVYAFILSSLF